MSLRGAVGGDRLQGGSAAKHEAKALGVIIKNQNVLHVPALGRICRWQVYRLLNDENSFRPRARLPAKRKNAKRIRRTIFGRRLKERRVEYSGPVMIAPSFHNLRYGKPSHHRYGASAGFCRATYGNILITSFEIDVIAEPLGVIAGVMEHGFVIPALPPSPLLVLHRGSLCRYANAP